MSQHRLWHGALCCYHRFVSKAHSSLLLKEDWNDPWEPLVAPSSYYSSNKQEDCSTIEVGISRDGSQLSSSLYLITSLTPPHSS
jgi:hypothetical protein